MRYTNVKTFHRDFFKEVENLPVTITKFGRPYLIVDRIPENMEPKSVEFSPAESPEKILGKCTMPGCKKEALEMGKKWNTDLGEFEDAQMCKFHAEGSNEAYEKE